MTHHDSTRELTLDADNRLDATGDSFEEGGTEATVSDHAPALTSATPVGETREPELSPSPDARGLTISSFVLGIVSIASGWIFFVPLTGLILGLVALHRKPAERALTVWGIALNGAMLLVSVVLLFLLGLLVLAVLATEPLPV